MDKKTVLLNVVVGSGSQAAPKIWIYAETTDPRDAARKSACGYSSRRNVVLYVRAPACIRSDGKNRAAAVALIFQS